MLNAPARRRPKAALSSSLPHRCTVDRRRLRTASVRAINVVGVQHRRRSTAYDLIAALDLPVVVVQDRAPGTFQDCCGILQQDQEGAASLTRRLLDRGEKSFWFVCPDRPWAGRIVAEAVMVRLDKGAFDRPVIKLPVAFAVGEATSGPEPAPEHRIAVGQTCWVGPARVSSRPGRDPQPRCDLAVGPHAGRPGPARAPRSTPAQPLPSPPCPRVIRTYHHSDRGCKFRFGRCRRATGPPDRQPESAFKILSTAPR